MPALAWSEGASYAGSASCAGCHAAQSTAWGHSQHALAMQPVGPASVLGNFGDVHLSTSTGPVRLFRRGKAWLADIAGPDGKPHTYTVTHTFGVSPLQQYLVEMPGGRLQVLPVAWDSRSAKDGGQHWFDLDAGPPLGSDDPMHWTRREHNWNFMCADCHATALAKRFDLSADRYDTRWMELGVGCEACHGPSGEHVASKGALPVPVRFGDRAQWHFAPGKPIAERQGLATQRAEPDVCGACHSRRSALMSPHRAGEPLLNDFMPESLRAGLYHPDGRQQDEVFVWGSWLQSKMYAKGVTCSDCHEPHSGTLRLPGNAVCAQCHRPEVFDTAAHHGHSADSSGSQCVNCHMPRDTYMQIDGRRDHSMSIPRPMQQARLGTPDACSSCHAGRSPAWAQDWLDKHDKAAPMPSRVDVLARATAGDAGVVPDLEALLSRDSEPAIVRSSALDALARLSPVRAGGQALSLLQSKEPLIRLAAARALDGGASCRGEELLADDLRAVRIEAVYSLAGCGSRLQGRALQRWQRARDDFLAVQHHNADRPEAWLMVARFQARTGDRLAAQAAFDGALRLDPSCVACLEEKSDFLWEAGDTRVGLALLEQAVARFPRSAPLWYAKGLRLARAGNSGEALRAMRQAQALDGGVARYAYAVVLLLAANDPIEAEHEAARALTRWPRDRDLLLTRVTLIRDAGRLDEARVAAKAFLDAWPEDPEARSLCRELRGP